MKRCSYDLPVSWVHADVRKLGRMPDGGGWRLQGCGERPNRHRGAGCDYVHTVVDDRSRVAYAEIHDDEKGAPAAAVLERPSVLRRSWCPPACLTIHLTTGSGVFDGIERGRLDWSCVRGCRRNNVSGHHI